MSGRARMGKTMAYRYIDEVLITVHSTAAPSEAEWKEYLHYSENHLPRSFRRTLVVTRGGGPDAKQRRQLQASVDLINARGEAPLQVAVVTDAMLVRGIVTALQWFHPHTRAFPVVGLPQALQYLGVAPGAPTEHLLREVRALERELG